MGNELVLTTPKAEKVRTIDVPGVVANELCRHLRDHASEGLLFRGRRGTPAIRRDQFYVSAWKPALEAAGLAGRFTFHALRHFCASTWLAEGAPLSAVAGHLGDTVETMIRAFVDEVVFGMHPTWTQASAGPYLANEASWKALQRAGFRLLGDYTADGDDACRVMVKDRPRS